MKKRDEFDESLVILNATFLKMATHANTRSFSPEELKAFDRNVAKARKVLANAKAGRKKKA